jgi:nicotinamide-nucleotide adenylyltransferase
MDSSWNPPSKAHYAITTHSFTSYDAHLLLFSSVNVDKKPHELIKERTDMMQLVAQRMQDDYKQANVAVASLAAATFAEKAPIILDHLASSDIKPTLVFFIGFDTVTRLFMKKYYHDSEQEMQRIMTDFFERDGCEVVCARRAVSQVAQKDVADQEEEELVRRPFVKPLVESGKLSFASIDGTDGISSTKIRNLLKEGDHGLTDAQRGELGDLAHQEMIDYCLKSGLYVASQKDPKL